MPRPATGYRNAAGAQVPGVTDVTKRYADKEKLINWAYGRGRKRLPLRDHKVLELGTIVHALIELDLKAASATALRDAADEMFAQANFTADDRDTVRHCFRAYRQWLRQHDVEVVSQEVSLVSERHQYGGTYDVVAYVDGVLAVIDPKTSAKAQLYPEHIVAMAAHAGLWNEHNPGHGHEVRAAHLIYLAKDGSGMRTFSYADLQRPWLQFQHWLAAFHLECGTEPAAPPPVTRERPRTVMPAPKTRLNGRPQLYLVQ